MNSALWSLTALELADVIASGEARSIDVVQAHFDRIALVNPAVNAITNVLVQTALEAAREVDLRRAKGEILGPFAGVPFTIKENIDVAGSATTHGVPALRGAVAPSDAPIVARLRQAGAIPVGRTNLPDLSIRFHTSSQLYGDTVNPWNPNLTPGGSSGGEGVALATGMSPLGLGNDAGGSVRIPALFGGVAALKPSYGRFPGDRSIGSRDLTLSSQWFPVDGVLARSIADLRAAFQVLAGPDARDPRTVPAPLWGPPLPQPIRVAAVPDPGELGVDPDARAAVELVARVLQDAGYVVETVDVPRLPEALEAYGHMIMTEFSQIWPVLERLLQPSGRRYIELSMTSRGPVDLAEYIRLTGVRYGIQRDWAEFFMKYPLVLGPVFTQQPGAAGSDAHDSEEHERIGKAMRLCTATSFVGAPAVAVPTGLANGLPQGVQIIAGLYREDLCLSAAAVIERGLGRLAPIEPRRGSQKSVADLGFALGAEQT